MKEPSKEEEKRAYRVGLLVLTVLTLVILIFLLRGAIKGKKEEKTPEMPVQAGVKEETEIERFGTTKERTISKIPKKGEIYTVQSGDTLYSIGEAAGIDWSKIAEANNLSEPYALYTGQTLTIPSE